MKLQNKDFLCLSDISNKELKAIIEEAEKIKKRNERSNYLKNKIITMIFQKPSTRTRVSFEVAIERLGGRAIVLNWNELQLSRGETIEDTARVLEKYVDCIIARVFFHSDLERMARVVSIPIINALSDYCHPCQALADLLTIKEKKGFSKKLKIAYIGDGNNVCNSLIFGCSKLGLKLIIASPKGYEPKDNILKKVNSKLIKIVNDPIVAAKDADVIYTDVWVSMGMENEKEERMKVFLPFQVNKELFDLAKKDAIFMHCLPAHRGLEVTDEIIDSERSVVFEQAENRIYTQQALLKFLLQ